MTLSGVRLSTEARQLEIVRAVLSLAAENSPDTITTQAIAQQMGLTQGAVFRHFATKEAIWLAVIDWLEETLGSAIACAVAEARAPLEALERLFNAHIAFIALYPSAPRLIFHELQKPVDNPVKQRVHQLLKRYRERVITLLAEARAAGQVDPALDESAAATLFVGLMQGLVMQTLLAGDPQTLQATAPRLLPLYLRGLGAQP